MNVRSSIVLIGMPAVGKSLLGEGLAKRLDYRFLDVDEVIESKTNLKLQQIIDRYGDERFMEIEEEAVLGLGDLDKCVVSPGGSVIYSARAMDFLKEHATVIFLDAPFESIKENLTNLEVRGIVRLKGKNLRAIFDERLALYRKYADITVEITADYDIDGIMEAIIRGLPDRQTRA